ncbi:protein N-terminal and lysine N-methyltransferase efm7 [Cocos nucifera]|uniref:Protein N-terminal and lysine N-methyltransferase efm7 n=1 Tax=Cocos nucifera TaxID=13894 RepID=A0A8K0I5C8_COCNU|nr:protein N-terminal and lysine N-methyltransferase efm7 [Cocos nucifera]
MDAALFSPASLFRSHDSDDDDEDHKGVQQQQLYVERTHAFPGMDLIIREFSFHQLNANLLWPGTFAFSEWLFQNQSLLCGRHILELGSGTGALAIFLKRSFGVDITTSDFDDKEIEENIAHNCRANELAVLPHIRYTWGEMFPTSEPDWDLIIASDILLYVKQYSNLIKTLSFLLEAYKRKDKKGVANFQVNQVVTISGKEVQLQWPLFLMSWRRRIGREEEALFFTGCEDVGLVTQHVGSRVYGISLKKDI